MAGLAATLNNPGKIDAMARALGARGPDGARCRLDGAGGARIEMAVRGEMPAIPRVVGGRSGRDTVAAFAIDGVASVTALDAGYIESGAEGLITGDDPYAAILAEAEQDVLVLARNADGPGLYYAEHGGGWLVASDPLALLRAGVPADPDAEVVRRFIQTGACDADRSTFFAGVRRVQSGEAVALGRDRELHIHRAGGPRARPTAITAVHRAVLRERVGIRLTPGLAGAALLAAALARPDLPRPVPVHTANFPDLGGTCARTPAVLLGLPPGAVRHTSHTFSATGFDLDAFLREMGEPVPDLGLYVLWEIARTLGGEIDLLADASLAESAHGEYVARVSDRLSARYGVALRCPLREAGTESPDLADELSTVLSRTLPPAAVAYATKDSAGTPTAGQLLDGMRDSVASAFAARSFAARPWADQASALNALRRLCDGQPVDDDALMRAYLVERWLRVVSGLSTSEARASRHATGAVGLAGTAAEPAEPAEPAGLAEPADISIGGTTWARLPVRTEVFVPGDQLAAKAAWYVADLVAGKPGGRAYRESLRGPWFAAISAKPVAVSQRRVCPLWSLKPGRAARVLARLARRRLPRLGDQWTMQVAISDAGLVRVAAGTLLSSLRAARWSEQLLPVEAGTVFPPREDAVAPADGAVVRAPLTPDSFAGAFADALRLALPSGYADTLAGIAVISADETGSRLLGFAPGPFIDAVLDAEAVITELCADNPAGQGSECTPVLLALRAPGAPQPPLDGRTGTLPSLLVR